MTRLKLKQMARIGFALMLVVFSSATYAQSETSEDDQANVRATIDNSLAIDTSDTGSPLVNDPVADNQGRLVILQALINGTREQREEIRNAIKVADLSELSELQVSLEMVNAELKKLNASFEQVAIGSVNVSLLGEVDTTFDWRNEVSEILQPIVTNLKALTDKPRKIGKLQSIIEQNELHAESISAALVSIENKALTLTDTDIQTSLKELKKVWLRYQDENNQELELARLQLRELQFSDTNLAVVAKRELIDFFKGRGLTLLIAVIASLVVWFLMRGVLKVFQHKSKHEGQDDYKTRKRIAQYAYSILTVFLIMIAVLVTFYVRGDMLLMVLSLLATAAVVLGLRQAVPRFISEGRLLLNVGSIRENERVFYNDIPWQVVSLNMNTVLKNPELTGVVRLPIKMLSSMLSRPAGKEPWFPTSKGDFIVVDDEKLLQTVRQTPETIELRDRGGTITAVPSAEFYRWTFRNLSRGKTFGISTEFGIDYRLQDISLNEVPATFKREVQKALSATSYADAIEDVRVELKSAGDSSLDYWIYVTVDSSAAKNYNGIARLLQRVCVQTCTEQNWSIPFPHLTVQPFK